LGVEASLEPKFTGAHVDAAGARQPIDGAITVVVEPVTDLVHGRDPAHTVPGPLAFAAGLDPLHADPQGTSADSRQRDALFTLIYELIAVIIDAITGLGAGQPGDGGTHRPVTGWVTDRGGHRSTRADAVAAGRPDAEAFIDSTVAIFVAAVADLVLGGTGDGVAGQSAVITDLVPLARALAQTGGTRRAQGLEALVDATIAVFVAASAAPLLGGCGRLRGASPQSAFDDDHAVSSTQPQAGAARIVLDTDFVAEAVTVVVQRVTHLAVGGTG
jgi:hypothetical protein